VRNGETTLRYLLRPIQAMLDDPHVTEVVMQRPGEVGVERRGQWEWHDVPDFDFRRLDAIGLLAGSLLSKKFDPAHPICMTTLPDGQRCTLIRPPATLPGTISATIRIPSRAIHTVHDADFPGLMEAARARLESARSSVDVELAELYRAKNWPAFFSLAVRARKTIVATGAVGSGKTTFLKRLMQEIPLHERIVTIEDTDEFGVLPQRNRVALFYGSANVTAEDAVAASLRMRPDRIMLQELRGAEAFAYIRALASGHPGGQTTWHAEDGDPWTPLALMVKTSTAGSTIPVDKLDQILRAFIDIVAFCKRDETGFHVPSVWFRDAEDDGEPLVLPTR
jgi:type IV secretion system protein VirB11